jgi:hypothetical protein
MCHSIIVRKLTDFNLVSGITLNTNYNVYRGFRSGNHVLRDRDNNILSLCFTRE